MDGFKYSVKLKNYHKFTLIFIPIAVVILFTLLLINNRDEHSFTFDIGFILLLIIASFFKHHSRIVEIQVFDNILNFKNIFGQDKFIYFKDLRSIKIPLNKFLVFETSKENIRGLNGFKELPMVIQEIKKLNPNFITKD